MPALSEMLTTVALHAPAGPRRQEPMPASPIPVLLLRRGPVPLRLLAALHADERFELFVAEELTPDRIAFAKRVAATLVASEDDPLDAFSYVVTAGIGRIVVLTPGRFRSEHEYVLAAGAAACITMPVAAADLDGIYELLQASAGSSRLDSTIRFLLDPIEHAVRYHDRSVTLTQREFAVLHCLSSTEGRPVSAGELLTYVWGEEPSAERSRRIVNVYIFQLRKKLETIGLKGVIATVRGFGYALVQPLP